MSSDRHRCVRLLLHAASVLCGACAIPAVEMAEGPTTVAFEDVSVVTMDGQAVLTNVTAVVEAGRVSAIGAPEEVAVPAGATRVDGRGRFLIPGLWDMHVHFGGGPEILGQFIAAGVTGVRVMWGYDWHIYYRDRIADGRTLGPEMYVGSTIIEGRPPPELADVIETEGRIIVADSTDGALAVRGLVEDGYDFIKVYNNVPLDAYRGVIAEARELGVPVAGHVPFEVGLEGALEAQETIEHLRGYVWRLVPAGADEQPGPDLRSRTISWSHADLSRIDELAEMTRLAGVWNVPTLSVRLVMQPEADIEAFLESAEAGYLTEAERGGFRNRRDIAWLSNFTEEDFTAAVDGFSVADSLVRALARRGGGVLAGTDTRPSGFALHRELEQLVSAGLTPRQALEAATLNPARFFGRNDGSGMVRVGSPADLVLLSGNPLEDISNVRRVVGVFRAGEWFDRAALDDLLAEAQAR